MPQTDLARNLDLPKRAVALVLAGGRGSRLKNLTDRRAKPAVYFGGKFRIIDFALSNCINSNIRRIGVVTQYKSHSLLRHLQRGWAFLRSEGNEFIAGVSALGAPADIDGRALDQSHSLALADIIGARRVRTSVTISSGSIPCR